MAKVEGLHYQVTGFSLDVPYWEFDDLGITCVWGPSGSGKTTLIQLLSGLLPASGFSFSVGKKNLSNLKPADKNIGFVFQDYGLFPHLTAWENIIFGVKARRIPEGQWRSFTEDLVQRLSLTPCLGRKAYLLSGGEKQRVALARALVSRPSIVFLDEPLSNLDEENKMQARQLIRDLSQEFEVPFLLVTHDMRDVRALASSILILSDGGVVGYGASQKVLDRPDTIKLAMANPENQVLYRRDFKGILDLEGEVVVAKRWSFEVKTGKTKYHVESVVDEGDRRKVQIRLGENLLQAWSHLEIDALGPDQNLQIETQLSTLHKIQ